MYGGSYAQDAVVAGVTGLLSVEVFLTEFINGLGGRSDKPDSDKIRVSPCARREK